MVSTSIDKYCHVSARYLPPFFEYESRIAYSKVELVKTKEEIEHPVVREVLKFVGVKKGVEIHNFNDLPARSGIGSSSSFTVGILQALRALLGERPDKKELALQAIHVEQELLKENVGCQDQVAAAFGGLNKITFGGSEKINVEPLALKPERQEAFEARLMLFFTGMSRNASEVAAEQVKNIPKKTMDLNRMFEMVEESIRILKGGDLDDFGRLLHETWKLKRGLSSQITNSSIDTIYEAGKKAGALGGKLLGAGGGGFMLFFVPPERKESVQKELNGFLHIPFHFDNEGSRVIYTQESL